MPSFLNTIRSRADYAFIAVAVVWLAFALYEWSVLLLWPVVALAAGGAMLRLRPGKKVTWAWTISAAVMGLVVAIYQVYLAVPLLQSAFSMVAGASLVVFVVIGGAHVVLAYTAASVNKPA
ncbi:MAG TPA: hypothetical protein VKF15_06390 [Nitrososphaerales archaeon]|nr:hypothetical protein [Nitrososphaerales archaeon]